MKVAIYARCSTNGQSVDSQLNGLSEYCQTRGFEVFKQYVDQGYSGTAKKRPMLDELMKDARRHKFKAVIVFRFDRFARSTRHLLSALEEFRASKISFISIQEAIDTTTPLGEALFTIISSISQLERDIIVERVKAGLAAAKAKGKKLGAPKKKADPRILQLRSEGESIRHIAKRLGMTKSVVEYAVRNNPTQRHPNLLTISQTEYL